MLIEKDIQIQCTDLTVISSVWCEVRLFAEAGPVMDGDARRSLVFFCLALVQMKRSFHGTPK